MTLHSSKVLTPDLYVMDVELAEVHYWFTHSNASLKNITTSPREIIQLSAEPESH